MIYSIFLVVPLLSDLIYLALGICCCTGNSHSVMVYLNLFCRKVQEAPLSIKDQEEKAKRSSFVQGLLLSTILDDNL